MKSILLSLNGVILKPLSSPWEKNNRRRFIFRPTLVELPQLLRSTCDLKQSPQDKLKAQV